MSTPIDPITGRARLGWRAQRAGRLHRFTVTFSDDPFGAELACPLCELDCTHVDDIVVTNATGRGVRVRCSGEDELASITVEPIEAADDGRRHTIHLVGTCEAGHRFGLGFHQHKGTTFLRVVDLGDYQPGEP